MDLFRATWKEWTEHTPDPSDSKTRGQNGQNGQNSEESSAGARFRSFPQHGQNWTQFPWTWTQFPFVAILDTESGHSGHTPEALQEEEESSGWKSKNRKIGQNPMEGSAAVSRTSPFTHTLSRMPPSHRASALLRTWLANRAETTVRAYRRDLELWAKWMGLEVREALRQLLEMEAGDAAALAEAYRGALISAHSPATVNRRLAALRSIVTAARDTGLVEWTLRVRNVRSVPYRDTRGPGVDGYRALMAALEEEGDTPRSRRDRALLAMLYTMALRRAEAVGLDMGDVDLDARRLWIVGKGRREREAVTIPPRTAALLAKWIEERGEEPGPVFVTLDRRAAGELRRLRLNSVTRRIRRLGERAGVKATPHGLRHAGITRALDLTGGDAREVQRLSRHAKLETLMLYDDARTDGAGRVSALLDADA